MQVHSMCISYDSGRPKSSLLHPGVETLTGPPGVLRHPRRFRNGSNEWSHNRFVIVLVSFFYYIPLIWNLYLETGPKYLYFLNDFGFDNDILNYNRQERSQHGNADSNGKPWNL